MNEPQGLYDEGRLAAGGLSPERITSRRVDDTNHYTSLFAAHATAAVAEAVRAELKLMQHRARCDTPGRACVRFRGTARVRAGGRPASPRP
ncbi:hypothetical protein ABZ318_11410 [Streptomyces sp. NPDC006197]|uniref:hypothetical protein n=1 Tax=Streptomyces sp. NPDC006197 TaxID=3156685 RepID=UPI0033B1F0BA